MSEHLRIGFIPLCDATALIVAVDKGFTAAEGLDVELVREVPEAMKPRSIKINYREGHYSILPYETTHNTGGAAMGADPKTSVVNRYLQSWDVSNVFVMGSSVFPQNPGYNPTGTVGALAYWAADAIRTKYLKNPGPLVQA